MVLIYLKTIVLETVDAEQLSAKLQLSEVERARESRFRDPNARLQFLAGRALLHDLMAERFPGQAFQCPPDAEGKPHLAFEQGGEAPNFSIAHSEALAGVAMTDGARVGLDVERLGRIIDPRVARRFFSKGETDWLETFSESEAARNRLRVWCLKEAVVKAIGTGIAGQYKRFTISPERTAPLFEAGHGEAQKSWSCIERSSADHLLALAVDRSGDHVQIEHSYFVP